MTRSQTMRDLFSSLSDTIRYDTIQYNTIQYNTIQYNTIQYNTIQYNTIIVKVHVPCIACPAGAHLQRLHFFWVAEFVGLYFVIRFCRLYIFLDRYEFANDFACFPRRNSSSQVGHRNLFHSSKVLLRNFYHCKMRYCIVR